MQLLGLAADGFRNLAPFHLAPSPRFNIFEGDNGQGKTNLLESVYLLSAFKSHRDARAGEMVALGGAMAAVRGEVLRRELRRTVEVQLTPKGKRVLLDDKPITALPAAAAHLGAIIFGPEDLGLTRGGPAPRRAFLDRAVYGCQPEHLAALRDYRQALDARNRLLRDARAGGRAVSLGRVDPVVLEAFEAGLVTHGLRVLSGRARFLADFRGRFQRILGEISDGALIGDVTLSLSSPFTPEALLEARGDGAGGLAELWLKALARAREADFRVGYTRSGPQADDLTCTLGGRDVRPYASQGQHRAFVLALKLAELEVTREVLGIFPVFLLDDVSSELDATRNAHLMRTLAGSGGQVFITTTDRRWIRLDAPDTCVWRLTEGRVEPS